MDKGYKIKAVLAPSTYNEWDTGIYKSGIYSVQANSWNSGCFPSSGDKYNPNSTMYYEYNASDDEEVLELPLCRGDIKINGGNIKKIIIGAFKGEDFGIAGSVILNIKNTTVPELIFRKYYTSTPPDDIDYTDRCRFYPFFQASNIYVPSNLVAKFKDSNDWFYYSKNIKDIATQKNSQDNSDLGIIGDTDFKLL